MQIELERIKVRKIFKDLVFNEEEHSYFVGDRQYISVSTQLKQFYTPFDDIEIAPFSAKKWNKNHPFKLKKTAEDLLAEWKAVADEACDRGHRVHLFGEDYPMFRTAVCIQERAIVDYYQDLDPKYEVFFLELQMFSPEMNYSGTGDIILWNTETNKISIRDWKTNKDLFKNFKEQKMLTPFEEMLDCPLSHYYLQLNLYKMLIENMTDLVVEDMQVIWLKQEEGNDKLYQTFEVPDLTEKLLPYYE
jgi:hypothetical protein